MTPILIVFMASLSVVLSSCQSNSTSATSPASGETAATVNGTKITVDEVNRVLAEQYRGQEKELAPMELAAARLQALESLITNEILYQRAQKENLNPPDDEVARYIQRNKEESGMTEQEFEKRLKEAGQTEQQFRDNIRKQIAIEKLQDKIFQSIKVQDREVEDFFNSNRQEFVARPGVAISDIIVDPADNGAKFDAKGEAAAQQKINELYSRLKSGTDFATLARAQSEDQSFSRSGDMGFVQQEQFPAFAQQGLAGLGEKLMAMNEGDITQPMKDSAGRWHIFKLTGKRTESRELTLNDPDVKTQITNRIRDQRRQLVNSAYIAQARDEAKVENFLAKAVIDSPNNLGVTRPVKPASASASPSPSGTASDHLPVSPSPASAK
ncbi:MAG TPA: SurA N-terminal domain-containing protein [Blastocatellia bacterium]|nr:SurA N-terminal domain-containing protein [Blastocatellia bacterium]